MRNFWNSLQSINRSFVEISIWSIVMFLLIAKKYFPFKYLNEVIFIVLAVMFIVYFANIFYSFAFWKKSKGTSFLRAAFFFHSCFSVQAFMFWFLKWRFAGESIHNSIIILDYIVPATVVYFVIWGRKKKEIFFDIMKPVFIRTIFFFFLSLFMSFQFFWLK